MTGWIRPTISVGYVLGNAGQVGVKRRMRSFEPVDVVT